MTVGCSCSRYLFNIFVMYMHGDISVSVFPAHAKSMAGQFDSVDVHAITFMYMSTKKKLYSHELGN